MGGERDEPRVRGRGRREQTEVTNVVPVAVGHVVGERGHELGRGVHSLDGTFCARVLRHKSDFLIYRKIKISFLLGVGTS